MGVLRIKKIATTTQKAINKIRNATFKADKKELKIMLHEDSNLYTDIQKKYGRIKIKVLFRCFLKDSRFKGVFEKYGENTLNELLRADKRLFDKFYNTLINE